LLDLAWMRTSDRSSMVDYQMVMATPISLDPGFRYYYMPLLI
jgi:hypothetical protein